MQSNMVSNRSLVFGVDLEYLLERDSPDGDVPSGTIPPVILRLIEEVESRGLQEIGICQQLSSSFYLVLKTFYRSSSWCSF